MYDAKDMSDKLSARQRLCLAFVEASEGVSSDTIMKAWDTVISASGMLPIPSQVRSRNLRQLVARGYLTLNEGIYRTTGRWTQHKEKFYLTTKDETRKVLAETLALLEKCVVRIKDQLSAYEQE